MSAGADDPSRHPRRSRGRPSTLDRPAVLDATWRVIARRGLERTRYVDIAEESGTPVSTLQNAFGSLSALQLAAVEHMSRLDMGMLTELPGPDEATASQRLEALVTGAIIGDDAYELWLVWLELWRGAARDSELAALSAEAYGVWWDATEAIIRDGQASGEFTADVAARDLAIAVVALIDGCIVALMLRPEPMPDETARVALVAVRRVVAPGA